MKITVSVVLMAALLASACSVEQTEEGELPEVEATGGMMPEYNVDAADVEVGTETREVVVPDLEVVPPDEEEPKETGVPRRTIPPPPPPPPEIEPPL